MDFERLAANGHLLSRLLSILRNRGLFPNDSQILDKSSQLLERQGVVPYIFQNEWR